MGTWKVLGLAAIASLVAVACGSGDAPETTEAGSVALGGACRAHADCAPIDGSEIRCRCTEGADVPVCDRLSNEGESCARTGSFSLECRSGMRCTLPPESTNFDDAICILAVGVGEECVRGTVECSPELLCNDSGVCSTGTLGLGEDCFVDEECQPQYRCDFFDGCVEPYASGADCSEAGVPTARTCAPGTGCAEDSERCTPLKADGADCFWDEECQAGECFFGSCGHTQRFEHIQKCGF